MFLYNVMGRMLLNQAGGEDDGGGGGSGGGDPFNELQQKALGAMINGAIKDHLKRSLGGAVSDALKAVNWAETLNLGETVSSLVAKQLEEAGGSGGGGSGGSKSKGGKEPGDELQRRLSALEQQLDQTEKARQAAEQRNREIEHQRHADRATNELRTHLQPKVRGELLDILVRDLGGRALKIDDEGNATLTVKHTPYKGMAEIEEDLPIAEAVPIWLNGESAKVFLPAPGSGGGSGGGAGNDKTKSRGGAGGAPHNTNNGSSGSGNSSDPGLRTVEQLERMGIDPSALFTD